MFRGDQLPELASLAWMVALLHLAGHALAKGGLFLAADGVFGATGSYPSPTPICCAAPRRYSGSARCSPR